MPDRPSSRLVRGTADKRRRRDVRLRDTSHATPEATSAAPTGFCCAVETARVPDVFACTAARRAVSLAVFKARFPCTVAVLSARLPASLAVSATRLPTSLAVSAARLPASLALSIAPLAVITAPLSFSTAASRTESLACCTRLLGFRRS